MKKFNIVTFCIGLVAWIMCAFFLFLALVTFVFSASKNVDISSVITDVKNKIELIYDV
ncbi:MAG: hypothetical protein MJ172_03740 [Clostridia bacterium]|nr:hypothetical protein [Clostridia bacterium]